MDCSTTPIAPIPPEILASILQLCLPAHTWEDSGPGMSHKHPSVVFSHVCHDWRQLVLGSPRLWSSIYVKTPISEYHRHDLEIWINRTKAAANKVKVWLERAGQCPISLLLRLSDLHFDGMPQPVAKAAFLDLITAIFSCVKQWRDVDIGLTCNRETLGPLGDLLLCQRAEDFPILESVSIYTFHEVRGAVPERADRISPTLLGAPLFSAPSLRRVTLTGQWDMSHASSVERIERWTSLTHLSVNNHLIGNTYDRFNASNALMLLEALPHLVEAAFTFQFEKRGNAYERKTPITLLHLERLYLEGVSMGPGFARSLRLPSLKYAYLVFHTCDFGDVYPDIAPVSSEGALEFIRKFGSQLSHVAISPDILTPPDLTSSLEILDAVVSLSAILPEFPDSQGGSGSHDGLSDVEGFSNSDETPEREEQDFATLVHIANKSVFPNLQHLEMHVRNVSDTGRCERALVDLIAARRRRIVDTKGEGGNQSTKETDETVEPIARTRIANVHIVFSGTQHVDIVQELDGRGVDLDIDPFNLRMVYPGSSGGLGTLPVRPWAPQYLE